MDYSKRAGYKYLPKGMQERLGGGSTTGAAEPTTSGQIANTQADIDAYRKFFNQTNLAQPKESKFDWFTRNIMGGKFMRGLGTAMMTPLRAMYGLVSQGYEPVLKAFNAKTLPEAWRKSRELGLEQSQALINQNKPSVWKQMLSAVAPIPYGIEGTKAAISSSWFAPEGGKFVNKSTTDIWKDLGASQRPLGEIFPAFGEAMTKFEGENVSGETGLSPRRWIGEHLKLVTPAGMGGLATDIAADPFTYGGGYGIGLGLKALNKKITSSILKGSIKKGTEIATEAATKIGKKALTPVIEDTIKTGAKNAAELGLLIDDAQKLGELIKRSTKVDVISKLADALKPINKRIDELTQYGNFIEKRMQEFLGKGSAYKAYKGAIDSINQSASISARRGLLGLLAYRTPEALALMSKRTQTASALTKGWGKFFIPSIEKNVPQEILNKIKINEAWAKNETNKSLTKLRIAQEPVVDKIVKAKGINKKQVVTLIEDRLKQGDDLTRNIETLNALKRTKDIAGISPKKLTKVDTKITKIEAEITDLRKRIIETDPLINQFADVHNIEIYKLENALEKANLLTEEAALPGAYGRRYKLKTVESAVVKKRNLGKANISELKPREFKTWKQAIAAGVDEVSYGESATRTISDVYARLAFAKTTDAIVDQFGVAAKNAPNWFVDVAGVKGVKFEPEIAQAMTNGVKLATDANIAKLIKYAWDYPLSVFKYTATASNLGFHVRNAISNYWLLFLKDGMQAFNPQTNAAAAYMSFYETFLKSSGREMPKWMTTKIVGSLSMKNVLDMMYERGVTGAFMKQDIGLLERGMEQTSKLKVMGKKVVATPIQIGSFVEDQARIVGFINSLKKYAPEFGTKIAGDMAAEQTFKFLFDYGDLTAIEKNFIKRAIPFYTWSRKNIPLQVEQLMKQPGKFALIEKLRRFEEALDSDIQNEKGSLPEYMQKLDVWGTPVKTKSGQRLWWNPNIAFNDLSRLLTIGGDVTSMVAPHLRIPLELKMNRQFFNQATITSGSGYTEAPIPSFMRPLLKAIPDTVLDKFGLHRTESGQYLTTQRRDYLLKNIPVLYNLAKSFPINKQEGAAAENLPYKRLSWLGGIKFIPSNAETNLLNMTKAEKAKYAKRIQQLKDVGLLPEDFTINDIRKMVGTQ